MALAFIENGAVIQYPIGAVDVRRKFPNTSFPRNIEEADLTAFGVVNVVDLPQPQFNNETQYLQENPPSSDNGVWLKTWSVVNYTTEELAVRQENKKSRVRSQRDSLLQNCDWVATTDTALTAEQQQPWIEYRQALRDVPSQPGFPDDVVWPTKPSNV